MAYDMEAVRQELERRKGAAPTMMPTGAQAPSYDLNAVRAELARRKNSQEAPAETDRYGRTASQVSQMLGDQSGAERGLGLGARTVIGGAGGTLDLLASVYNLPAAGLNAIFGREIAPEVLSFKETGEQLFDAATQDAYTPRTSSERIITEGAGAAVGPGFGGKAFQALGKAAPAATNVAKGAFNGLKEGGQRLVKTLFEPTAANIGANAGGAAAGQAAREAGASAPVQVAASLGGGATAAGAFSAIKPVVKFLGARAPTAITKAAEKAGFIPNPEQKFLDKRLQKAKVKPENVKEAQDLQEKTGIKLDLAEASRNPIVKSVADMLANGPEIGAFAERNAARNDQIIERVQNLANKIEAESKTPTELGEGLIKDARSIADDLIKRRADAAKADFSNLEGEIPLSHTQGALDSIIKELDLPVKPKTVEGALKEASELKSQISETGNITGANLQKLMESFGKRGAASGAVFKDLGTAAQRRYMNIIQNGFRKDLDAAAEAGGPEAQQLLNARNRYRDMSKNIEDFENSFLVKLVGKNFDKSPEDIAKKISPAKKGGGLKESEVKKLVSTLREFRPEKLEEVKKFYLENAIENAKNAGTHRETEFSRGDIHARNLLRVVDKKVLRQLFDTDEKTAQDMVDILRVVNMINDFGVRTEGSQSFQRIYEALESKDKDVPLSLAKGFAKLGQNVLDSFKGDIDREKLYELFNKPEYLEKLTKAPLTREELGLLNMRDTTYLRGAEAVNAGRKKKAFGEDVEIEFYKPGEKKPFSEKLP